MNRDTGWVFEGKAKGADTAVIQINLHSFEKRPTGVLIMIDSKTRHAAAMFRGPAALSKAHYCMAAVLDAIVELSDDAYPEAFDVHAPVLESGPSSSATVRLEGRVTDAITAFSAYFGSALKDNVRIKHAAGVES